MRPTALPVRLQEKLTKLIINLTAWRNIMQEHLYENFYDSEHSGFLNDVSITFIDKTDPTNPLQREHYWKHTLETFTPYSINIKENV